MKKKTGTAKRLGFLKYGAAACLILSLLTGCGTESTAEKDSGNAAENSIKNSIENNNENGIENSAGNSIENDIENSAENSIENNIENSMRNDAENGSEAHTDTAAGSSEEDTRREEVEAAAQIFFETAKQHHYGQQTEEHQYILLDIPVISFCPKTGDEALDKIMGEVFLKVESSVGTAVRNSGAAAQRYETAEQEAEKNEAFGFEADKHEADENEADEHETAVSGILIDYTLYNKGIFTSFTPEIVLCGFSEKNADAISAEIIRATAGIKGMTPAENTLQDTEGVQPGENTVQDTAVVQPGENTVQDTPVVQPAENTLQGTESVQPEKVIAYRTITYSSEKHDFITARDLFFEPSFIVLKKDWLDADEAAVSVLGGMDEGYDVNRFEAFGFTENGLKFEAENISPFTVSYDYLLPYLKVTYDGDDNDYPVRTDLDPDKPMVALTFDDGPGAGTKRIAKIISEYGGRCTFFTIARQTEAESSRETIQYVLDCGHEYASHSYEHKNMSRLTPEEYWTDMYKAVTDIVAATGKCPTLMRLPGGNINDFIQENNPFTLCYWGMGTADWSYRTLLDTREEVVQAIWKVANDFLPSSGKSCLLMHDLYSETASAVEYMVPILAQRGYQFVTVSELLYYKGLEKGPGHYYNAAALK